MFHKTVDELRTEPRVTTSHQTLAKYDELTVEDTQADTTARTENNANAKQDDANQKVLTPEQEKAQENTKPQDTKCSGTQSQAANKQRKRKQNKVRKEKSATPDKITSTRKRNAMLEQQANRPMRAQ